MNEEQDTSKVLAAASSRLLELAEKGERVFVAELLRRVAEEGRDDVTIEVDAATGRAGMVDHSPLPAGVFADARRLCDAIDVALALLDEMFVLVPGEPRRAVAQDVADVFHEISRIAKLGESATRNAAEKRS